MTVQEFLNWYASIYPTAQSTVDRFSTYETDTSARESIKFSSSDVFHTQIIKFSEWLQEQ